MKQYILHAASDAAIASQQAREAIDRGYRWLQIVLPQDIDADRQREIAEAIANECRDSSVNEAEAAEIETIMTLVDNAALVDQLKISGLHMSNPLPQLVAAAREQLGAHAIIGADCLTPDQALALKPLDIDYITVDTDNTPEATRRLAEICEIVNGQGHRHHIVAKGAFDNATEQQLLDSGVAGFAIDDNANDPTTNPT